MVCLIAAEKEVAQIIKANLEKSGQYAGWRFEVCGDASELGRWSGLADVVVVSRFLPGRDPMALLKELRLLFPTAHIVLLAGAASEAQRSYIRAAQRLGFYNIVTGRLPGDRPYTIFVALKTAREPELEGYAALEGAGEERLAGGVDEEPKRPAEDIVMPPQSQPVSSEERSAARRPATAPTGYADQLAGCSTSRAARADEVRSLREALDAGDLEAVRERLAGVLAVLEGDWAEETAERMERTFAARQGVLVLTAANKGGVGKTTVAAAVATALARAGVPTVIVDLDFGSPDVAHLFGIRDVPGIEVLAGKPVREGVLRDVIVPVKNGPDVLPGPMDASMPAMKPGQVAEIMGVLRRMYGVVVGDTPPEFWTKPWLADVFAEADYVLAVVDQSVQSEQDTRSYAPYLLSMGVKPERIGIVLNRYSPKLHNPRAVEQLFCAGFKKTVKELPKVVAVIPEDWEAYVRQGYKGSVAGLDDARHAWHKLAEKIASMAGYSYKDESRNAAREKKAFFGVFKRR